MIHSKLIVLSISEYNDIFCWIKYNVEVIRGNEGLDYSQTPNNEVV